MSEIDRRGNLSRIFWRLDADAADLGRVFHYDRLDRQIYHLYADEEDLGWAWPWEKVNQAANWLVSATEGAQNAFVRLEKTGANGIGLKNLVALFAPLAQGLTKSSLATTAEQKLAYDHLYHLQRPELQSAAKVPDWLMRQVKTTTYGVIKAGGRIKIDFEMNPPLLSRIIDAAVFVAGQIPQEAANLAKRVSGGLWGRIPTWAKVGGAVTLGITALALGIIAVRQVRGVAGLGFPSRPVQTVRYNPKSKRLVVRTVRKPKPKR